jgi:hypothetical protein
MQYLHVLQVVLFVSECQAGRSTRIVLFAPQLGGTACLGIPALFVLEYPVLLRSESRYFIARNIQKKAEIMKTVIV